jgi:hypothetical protein
MYGRERVCSMFSLVEGTKYADSLVLQRMWQFTANGCMGNRPDQGDVCRTLD